MRIGVIWDGNSNAHYRAIIPLREMEKRGHEVVWPADRKTGAPDLRWLASCDVVHVFRRSDPGTLKVLGELAKDGTAITWDNDDDLSALPEESPSFKQAGGLKARKIYSATVKAARMATVVTTPSELLAEKYAAAGAQQVEVMPNLLSPDALERRGERHEGVVIGWVAGLEHTADARRLRLAEVLRRVLAADPQIRVESIGVDLSLRERYRHDAFVHFVRLPERMARFDIGIAPLADIPFNRARSDVKLKEYAACGIPWLASPVGPYEGLGEQEGGQLVADDDWERALLELAGSARRRRRLARRGRKWAKKNTIEAGADDWERLFLGAAKHPVALSVS
jgi:glycosyltransferase involved in cell wall biosynthesis